MNKMIIKNGALVNEGLIEMKDILISGNTIQRIDNDISDPDASIVDAQGLHILPGCIDDQVHFREPGLTHKADIASESRAAVAGGVTSFMEMPNTIPNALTRDLLEDKYTIASKCSPANYSFFMGASNNNLEEILKIDYRKVCGIKVFMGSSTGNMLVDNQEALEQLFKHAPVLLASHCEDEKTIQQNLLRAKEKYGEEIPVKQHPVIRSREACYISSAQAIALAKKYNTRFHILHISTKEEPELFDSKTPLKQKRITSEACVHHLFFNDSDYDRLGNKIKCNPAIKEKSDAEAVADALKTHKIDIVATDHAPHTWEEKSRKYADAPAGLPLVQFPLSMMITMGDQYGWDLPFIVEKMAHNPAICFQISDRGYIREGYFADLVLVNASEWFKVESRNLLYKCKWSPLEGLDLKGRVAATYVNGKLVYDGQQVYADIPGHRLTFDRQ
jgi:dihydroorotase